MTTRSAVPLTLVLLFSAAPMKTHNIVLVTLSLKNILLGAPLENCLYHFKLDDKTAEIYNIRS